MTNREAKANAHHIVYALIEQNMAAASRDLDTPDEDHAKIDKHLDILAQYHFNKAHDLMEPPRKRRPPA